LTLEDIPPEEMWKVIEDFGISRAMVEKHNPNYQKVKDLYLAIKKK